VHRAGAESWSASINISQVMHVALYVRDALRLQVPESTIVPPPVDGRVVDHSGDMDFERRLRAGGQWLSWWEEIVRLEGAKALRMLRLPEGVDASETMSAVHDRLFDWPALDALASWPDLRDAAREIRDDAVRWAGNRKRLFVERGPLTRGWGNVPIDEIAERVAERSRAPSPLVRAAVFLLGVQGDWSALVVPGVLLCSSSLAQDAERMAVLAEEALVSGADAEEVRIEYKPRDFVPPPSVLHEPLVLWRGEDASLICERVIPYRDGFEVELRRHGLGPSPTSEWRGPGARRPNPFAGLQVHVRFADGREDLLDDVERDDREGPVTITTFGRRGYGDDTLWLWVMPLPPAGEVRLSVEWPTYGIESVSVSIDGTTIRPREDA
jgi:hypothetical protein